MLSCQSFRQMSTVKVLGLVLGLLLAMPAKAYRLECKWVMDPNVDNFVTSQTPKRIERAFVAYTKLMKIEGLQMKDDVMLIKHNRQALDQVKSRLRRMTPEEKTELKHLVRAIYNEVKAFKYQAGGEATTESGNTRPFKSFKRHLDLILSAETGAHEFFQRKMKQEWKSLEDTLTDYFKLMHDWTGSSVIQEGKDILMTALRLQDRYLKPGSQYEKETIVLFGSFINGRAYLEKSDLDFAVYHPGFEAQIREHQNLLSEMPDFAFSSAEPHVIQPGTVHNLGYMNPLLVLIKKDHVVVRVYKNRLSSEESRKPGFFDDYYF